MKRIERNSTCGMYLQSGCIFINRIIFSICLYKNFMVRHFYFIIAILLHYDIYNFRFSNHFRIILAKKYEIFYIHTYIVYEYKMDFVNFKFDLNIFYLQYENCILFKLKR